MPRIHDIPQPDDPRRTERAETRRTEQAKRQARAQDAAPSDSVELPDDVRRVQDLQNRLTEEARSAPDIREDRVSQARAKLESGELDSEDVRRTIADRLLEQFGI